MMQKEGHYVPHLGGAPAVAASNIERRAILWVKETGPAPLSRL